LIFAPLKIPVFVDEISINCCRLARAPSKLKTQVFRPSLVEGAFLMRRLLSVCAILSVAAPVFAVTSPAQASPYHVIRWSSGRCQVWDAFWQSPTWLNDYSIITGTLPTWDAASETKARLIQEHRCRPE
jgi:hypothetical protein